jgi:hypothetical protein
MTELLKQAFAQASKLSPQQQDVVADWLLRELEADNRWDEVFIKSQDILAKLGSEAIAEHRQGITQEFTPDNL